MDSLTKLIKRFHEKGSNLESSSTPDIAAPEAVTAVKGVKLKYWPDEVACLPNEWVRSGIFSTSNKLKYEINPLTNKPERIYHRNLLIPTWSENVKIYYTGYELTMFDLHVWMACIMLAKHYFLGNLITLTPFDFCEAAQVVRGGKTVKLIYESLNRLFHGSLQSRLYKDGKMIREYNDHMIESFYINKTTDKWEISLNRRFYPMFQSQTTWIDWNKWTSFKSDITKSLMMQVCSHEAHSSNPQKISLMKLKELMRNGQPMFSFRKLIKNNAFKLLDCGVVKELKFENDVLTFVRQ